MYISSPVSRTRPCRAPARRSSKDFGAQVGEDPNPYSAYARPGDAGHARRRSGSRRRPRPQVADKLLQTKVTNGILGTFTINANGDTNNNPVTLYKLVSPGKGVTFKMITPPASLVKVS